MLTPKKRTDIIAYLPLAWYFFEEEKEKTVGGGGGVKISLVEHNPLYFNVFQSQIMKE